MENSKLLTSVPPQTFLTYHCYTKLHCIELKVNL
uniref:Uncharacterized protein n=1 Tax=Arundo donax TaxID=35708 RepID=A0A0A8Y1Z0_ARUDO